MLPFQRLYPAIFRVKFNILTLTYEPWKESESACSGDYYCVRVKHLPALPLDTSAPVYLLQKARGWLQGFFPLEFLTLSSLFPSGILNSIPVSMRNTKLHFG